MSSEINRDMHIPWIFVLFCVATFLSFLGTSSISYFSVILADIGMNNENIGWVLGSALIPTVVGILLCGELLSRFSSLQIALSGQWVILAAYASFIFTIHNPLFASLSRLTIGLGFGLFFPAALIYARSLISGSNTVFLFGIYTTMIPLPNLIGPGLAEVIYNNAGMEMMLWIFTASIMIGLGMSLLLPKVGRGPSVRTKAKFLDVLFNRKNILPYFSIITVGLLWGFMLSFIALYLKTVGISAVTFFSTATGAMLVSRFTIMACMGRKSRYFVSGLGLLLMALGYIFLPIGSTEIFVVFSSALIFGLGYSFAFPVLSLWATDHYPLAERGRPMAIFTALFQGGIFTIPLIAGVISERYTLSYLFYFLAALAALMSIVLLYAGCKAHTENEAN